MRRTLAFGSPALLSDILPADRRLNCAGDPAAMVLAFWDGWERASF
jgi:hypothetical protein